MQNNISSGKKTQKKQLTAVSLNVIVGSILLQARKRILGMERKEGRKEGGKEGGREGRREGGKEGFNR